MPYYKTPLASNFTIAEYITSSSPLFNPTPPIPPSVLNNMRIIDNVGYAPLPKELKGRRNVVCKDSRANLLYDARGESIDATRAADDKRARAGYRRESGPKFRSEKGKKGEEVAIEEEGVAVVGGAALPMMPRYYRQVEIKYSKFGVEVSAAFVVDMVTYTDTAACDEQDFDFE